MLIPILIILIVIFDQMSKLFAVSHLQDVGSHSFIPGLLSFHYHENKGAAWGMFSEHRWVFLLASSVAILAIITYFVYMFFKKEKIPFLQAIALCFFCGGGIGNMIDRVFLGYVVDFLEFDFIEFPIFNVADSFITVGAVLLVIYLILDCWKEYRNKKSAKAENKENINA